MNIQLGDVTFIDDALAIYSGNISIQQKIFLLKQKLAKAASNEKEMIDTMLFNLTHLDMQEPIRNPYTEKTVKSNIGTRNLEDLSTSVPASKPAYNEFYHPLVTEADFIKKVPAQSLLKTAVIAAAAYMVLK